MKQREIKFRWIAPQTGRWEYINIEDITAEIDFGGTLGQYTGLKDKNEKEIYEGDIVKNKHGYLSKIELVEFFEGGFSPFANDLDEVFCWRKEDCEIIGNIYENPNLLK